MEISAEAMEALNRLFSQKIQDCQATMQQKFDQLKEQLKEKVESMSTSKRERKKQRSIQIVSRWLENQNVVFKEDDYQEKPKDSHSYLLKPSNRRKKVSFKEDDELQRSKYKSVIFEVPPFASSIIQEISREKPAVATKEDKELLRSEYESFVFINSTIPEPKEDQIHLVDQQEGEISLVSEQEEHKQNLIVSLSNDQEEIIVTAPTNTSDVGELEEHKEPEHIDFIVGDAFCWKPKEIKTKLIGDFKSYITDYPTLRNKNNPYYPRESWITNPKSGRLTYATFDGHIRTNINPKSKTKPSITIYTQKGTFQAIDRSNPSSELITIIIQSSTTFSLLFRKLCVRGPPQTFIWRPGDILSDSQDLLRGATQCPDPLVLIKRLVQKNLHKKLHLAIFIKQPPRRCSNHRLLPIKIKSYLPRKISDTLLTQEGLLTTLEQPKTSSDLIRTEAHAPNTNYSQGPEIDRLTYASCNGHMGTIINNWGIKENITMIYVQKGIFQAIDHANRSSELFTNDVQSSATCSLPILKFCVCGLLQNFVWQPGDSLKFLEAPLAHDNQVYNPLDGAGAGDELEPTISEEWSRPRPWRTYVWTDLRRPIRAPPWKQHEKVFPKEKEPSYSSFKTTYQGEELMVYFYLPHKKKDVGRKTMPDPMHKKINKYPLDLQAQVNTENYVWDPGKIQRTWIQLII